MPGPVDTLNRPLRDLRISLTDQCNFRCAYCMPREIFGPDYAFLPREALLAEDEIILLAQCFSTLGIQKIRLTGGEPLLRRDLDRIVRRLVEEVGIEDISLTTNGSLLPRYAQRLRQAGLRRVNVSLDSLDAGRFAAMNGGKATPDTVLAGIDAAEKAGLAIKINMVAKLGINEEDILPMVEYFRQRRMTLRFIEYMDVGHTNQWKLGQVVPASRILERIASRYRFEPVDPAYRGEVASRYRFLDTETEFGIITSITQPFCRDCNRARLSADGKLFTCLFARSGSDLKALLRSGASREELTAAIEAIWLRRGDQYSQERGATPAGDSPKIEMSYIGG